MDVVGRRLDLLKFEGLGLSRVEIVKQLSQKYACSERSIYNDFETRTTWQSSLLSSIKIDDILLKLHNRLEQIYSQASKRAISSTNHFVQLAALQLMYKITFKNFEVAIMPEMLLRLEALEKKIAKGGFLP